MVPSASVIVPIHGAEPTLERCLASLQTLHERPCRIEVLCCDRGSTDRSRAIAAAAGARLVDARGCGPYAARNAGVRSSTGEVLLFTEATCVVNPDWIERHLETLDDPDRSLSVGPLAPVTSTRRLDRFLAYEHVRDEWNFASECPQRYFGRPTNLATRRECFEEHGPFEDVLRGGDSIFVQRVARARGCHAIRYTPDAIVRHLELRDMVSCLRQRVRFSYLMSSLKSSHTEPLPLSMRVRVLRETIRREGLGPGQSLSLAGSLLLGNLAFKFGRWRAAVRPYRPDREN